MDNISIYEPVIRWIPANHAPQPPAYCSSTVSGGYPQDNVLRTGGSRPHLPVIEYEGYQYWCFRYRDQRDAICMVAYDSELMISGVISLEGIKDVNVIQSDSSNRTLVFSEPGQEDDYLQSWFILHVRSWIGRAPDPEDNQLLDMLPNCSFNLGNEHGQLVYEAGVLNLVVIPDEVTRPDAWLFEKGALIHQNSKLALALKAGKLVCEPLDSSSQEQQWQLTSTGELFNVGGQGVVSYDDNRDIPLVVEPAYEVSEKHKAVWKLGIPRSEPEVDRPRAPGKMLVHKLEVVARLSDDYWSGTGDAILLALGYPQQVVTLFDAPQRGAWVNKEVDFRELLGKQHVTITDLAEINIYQVGNSVYGSAWKLESFELIVNGYCRYGAFKNMNRWFAGVGARRELVASWPIYPWLWRSDDNRPFDYNGKTYPMGLLPYIGDLLRWRSYDPSTIDGVGQLMGVHDGRLVGENLKTRRTELLKPNSTGDSYTWVYTPDGAIIYKLWDHRESHASYVRHSQLASGQPVICAGELRIVRQQQFIEVEEVIGLINDASGHYRPDGGACLVPFMRKLQDLGISTLSTKLSWRSRE